MLTGRELFTASNEYFIYPLADEDRANHTELCRQISGDNTVLLNSDVADKAWADILNGETKIYSIFNKDDEYCGSLALKNPATKTPEIGIDLLREKRNRGGGVKLVRIFAKKVYEGGGVDYFISKISSKNSHSLHAFRDVGITQIGQEDSPYTAFLKQYKSKLSKPEFEKFKQDIKQKFGVENCDETEVVYIYKFPPESFMGV